MRKILKWGAAVVVVGALGAVAFAWSGLFNVAASVGHLPVTAWFLHFTMQNSVRTHAYGIRPPANLDDPALIARGAGHYHLGCATCHGAPEMSRNPIVKQMVPPPPYLVGKIESWRPRELFWIVKHGIKYAGMPSWPADNRDDEVWAVTAFLLKLPEIDADRYSRLATGSGLSSPSEPLAAPSKGPEDLDMLPSPGLSTLAGENQSPITTCAQCHGPDGRGRDGDAFPNISGQKAAYLRATLEDYAAGVRNSGIMQPVAHALTKAQIETLVEHFSAFEWQQAAQPAGEPTADLELGRRIAEQGKQDQSVPACQSCHDEAGADLRPHFPRIAGQHESFIRQQLELFRDKKRGGRRAALMQGTAERMSDKEIAAVAAYYARLKPGAPQPSQRSETE